MEDRLTDQQLDLIQRLYGFGTSELTLEQYQALHPELNEDQLRELEAGALRTLRHLDCSFLNQKRKAG